jgi:thioesterase domain-containing protein/acyl carrier protein
VFLHRVSGNSDLGIGMVFHNRLSEEDRATAGLFVNLFPLHLRIDPEETFVSLLRKTMAESFAAVRYGPHCISNPGRKRAYEVLFNYLPMTYPPFAGRPTRVRWVHTGASDGSHSLSLHVHDFDESGELELVFDFNTGVFTPDDQARALAEFDSLLDRFLEEPQRLLRSLPLPDAGGAHAPARSQATSPADRAAWEPPANETQAHLVSIWEDLLGRKPIGVRDNFFELGGHSLLAVSLVARVEQELGRSMSLTGIFETPTIAELSASLHDDRGEETDEASPILVPVRASGSRPPFFCVPGAGGSGFRLWNLAHQLDSDRPFYTFRQPEGDGLRSVEQTAAIYCRELREVQASGPYLLGGTCLGTLVAFEMAQQLRASGEEVPLLALINAQGSVDYRIYRWVGKRIDRLLRLLGLDPPSRHDLVIDLLWQARRYRREAMGLATHFRRTASTSARERRRQDPASVGPTVRRLRGAGLRQSRWALSYRPRPYPGRVMLFTAANASMRKLHDEVAQWAAVATAGLEVHSVPGDHNTLFEEPNVGELARALSDAFSEAHFEPRHEPRRARGEA